MKKILKFSFCAVALLAVNFIQAQDWSMKKANIMTAYAATIDTANVLPEYPRPQMVREQWKNLNGIWQFQPGTGFTQVPPKGTLTGKILVPFPVESAISGVMQHYDNLLYRRQFSIPESWTGQRILLHFGAVDYKCQIYINGIILGNHTGGYDPFSFDITSRLSGEGPYEITVKVNDPTDAAGIPRGKQTLYPGDITYTSTSGIWQTVWLEPVPETYISDLKITPDVDHACVSVQANVVSADSTTTAKIDVLENGHIVSTVSGAVNSELKIPVENARLWSPNDPFLYDLKVQILKNDEVLDSVDSYFGMRKISVEQDGSFKKIFLNNQRIFQFGPLDQGFWPDGIYTAPTDSAMLFDLQKIKACGYNMVRKHIKVEPQRWYYYADKLGILVWQDMPSVNSYTSNPQTIDKVAFRIQLENMVKLHYNSPSIIMWVVFNEEQGQHDTELLVADVISLDSTRLVNENSGVVYTGVGHVKDVHSYPQPACPVSTDQALVCGEYGSIGLKEDGHTWSDGGVSFIMTENSDEFFDIYKTYAESIIQYKSDNGLSAAVFTQITDVENELNGIYTYDRSVGKLDEEKLSELNQQVINDYLQIDHLVADSKSEGQLWKYKTSTPSGTWYAEDYDDSNWSTGYAGFGSSGTPGGTIRTDWTSANIWLRKNFETTNLTAEDMQKVELYVHHDEDCEIYINGVLAANLTGYTSEYGFVEITDAARNALKSNGENVIAIHCYQTSGGQYIDAGLMIRNYVSGDISNTSEIKTQNKVCMIYPNPAHNFISIKKKNQEVCLCGVFNQLGKKVITVDPQASGICLSGLNTGIYFLKTKYNLATQYVTFIKD